MVIRMYYFTVCTYQFVFVYRTCMCMYLKVFKRETTLGFLKGLFVCIHTTLPSYAQEKKTTGV